MAGKVRPFPLTIALEASLAMRRRNLLKLAAAGAVGTYVATLPAGPAAAATATAGVATRTGYWCAGDSLTEGLQSSTLDSWRGYLMDKLSAAAPGGWYFTGSRQTGTRNLLHDGWGGRMISQVASFIPASFGSVPGNGQPAHVVIWNAGTNDSRPPGGQPDRSAQQMLDDTSAALDRIHLAGPHVKVLLQQISLTPRNTAAEQQAEQDFDNGLPALVASRPWVRLVDLRGAEIGPDAVHYDDAGYADVAGRIYAALSTAGWLPGSTVDHRVSLLAHANWRYVTADAGGTKPLIANRTAVGTWERFEVVDLGDGTGDVALWSDYNGRYVAADSFGNAPLIANRTAVGAWERFGLTSNPDGSISLQARVNGLYVTAEAGGTKPLIANRTAVGDWEKFTLTAP
jgi:lysophospholipase L1-like esterase